MLKLSSAEKVIFSFLLFIAAMLTMRIMYANNIRYIFLLWNLFLAWIPFQLAIVITTNRYYNKWIKYGLVLCWLLFFPNALYIVTDLIHLEHSHDTVPVWFDAVLLFTCSITGLMMAYISLFQVESFLRKNLSAKHTGKLVFASLFLGSFGVYVGRFLRWNSWDIVTDPSPLFLQIGKHIIMPQQHFRTWAVTMLLTCLFSLLYYAAKQLTVPVTLKDNYKNLN